MKLNDLKSDPLSKSNKKRIGRGIGSGKGKTSGKGHKGQKSRSGVSIKGFEGGQMPIHRRLPKRGFSNHLFRKKYQIVNLRDINSLDMNEIDSNILFDNGLIDSSLQPVKILGDGDITKAIIIKATKFSKSAILKIEKAGGKAELQ